jgi:hypothetical protein
MRGSLLGVFGRAGALAVVIATAAPARADEPAPVDATAGEPGTPTAVPTPAATGAPAPTGRRWSMMAGANFALRGNQGNVVGYGFRFVMVAGFMSGTGDVYVSYDRKLGANDRLDDNGGEYGWSSWNLSLRGGRRFRLGPGLWVMTSGGLTLLHADLVGPNGETGGRYNVGVDAAVVGVRRSGYVAASLILGLTMVPFAQDVDVGTAQIRLPAHVEPWIGIGAGFAY